MPRVRVTHFTDPGCPWAWSASPALAALAWRYGDQLAWRHVMIGLTETASQYEQRGYTPLAMARANRRFRRFGMPFDPQPKDRVAGTSPACRAVVAARLLAPGREWAVLRALQVMQFCSSGLLDEAADIRSALRDVPGIDADAVLAALDSEPVRAAYERDRAEARTAEGTPAEAQAKTARTDGPVRYTAPSLVLEAGGRRLVAGGFQSLMAYDVLLANLDPALERRGAPEDLGEVLRAFPDGLTTAEVAEVLAEGPAQETDRGRAQDELLELAAAGRAVRIPVGDDALWIVGRSSRAPAARRDGRLAAA